MIINQSKNIVLCNRSKLLKCILSKAVGLMFSRKKEDLGLIFAFDKPRIMDIHMFFVFYSIDILFLDEKYVVIEKVHLKPFTIYKSRNKSKYFVELIDAKGTQVGDKLKLGSQIQK